MFQALLLTTIRRRLAAQHLIKMGHKKIGIVGYERKVRIIRDRYEGFSKVLKENKIKENFFIEIPVGTLDLIRYWRK
ncbi:MAG: hypothetical protein U5N58_08605 [Actinomycetota bacterium]|nr:hypothetical protein [Actinomycetota bacterium]